MNSKKNSTRTASNNNANAGKRGARLPGVRRDLFLAEKSRCYEHAAMGVLVADALLSALDRCGDKWALVEALRVFALDNDKESSAWDDDAALIPFFRAADGMPGLDAIRTHVAVSLEDRRASSLTAVVATCACWLTESDIDDQLDAVAFCGFDLAEVLGNSGIERRNRAEPGFDAHAEANDIEALLECIASIAAGATSVKKAS